jgi:hypothetical protein
MVLLWAPNARLLHASGFLAASVLVCFERSKQAPYVVLRT